MNPLENIQAFPNKNGKGITLLDYFIAHAPEKPQWDFDVPMKTKKPESIFEENRTPDGYPDNFKEIEEWKTKRKQKRAKMWASEWAKAQLKERQKYE